MAHTATRTSRFEHSANRDPCATTAPTLRLVHDLERETARAHRSAQEYSRALREYNQLVRHRIANPLTAIRGGAQTLLADPEMEAPLRVQLLEMIVEMTKRLEHLSLAPTIQRCEEACLQSTPKPERRTNGI
jgi:signal transduction histidine kinase